MRISIENSFTTIARLSLIALIIICFSKFKYVACKSVDAVRNFASVGYDFERVRTRNRVFASLLEAKTILPEGALIKKPNIVFSGVGLYTRTRYILYPRLITENWSHFIDFENSINEIPNGWQRHILRTGTNIYAKPGYGFITEPPTPTTSPLLKTVVVFLIAALLNTLTGLAVLSLLKIFFKENGVLWYLSTAYLIGFIVITTIIGLYLLCGGTLTPLPLLTVCTVLLITLIAISFKNFVATCKNILNFRRRVTTVLKADPKVILAFLLASLIIVLILIRTIHIPVTSHDAMSHWLMKAKVIFHEKAFIFDYTHHNEYPVLWPLNIAIQFCLLGSDNDIIAKWTVGLLFLAFAVQLTEGLRFLNIKSAAIGVILFLHFSIFYHDSISSAYAETAFLAFTTAALMAALGWIKYPQRNNFLILAIIMSAGVSLTKLEGIPTSLIIGISLALVCTKGFLSKKAWIAIGAFTFTASLGIGWAIWVNFKGYCPKMAHLTSVPSLEKLLFIIEPIIDCIQASHISRGIFAGILLLALMQKHNRNLTRAECFLILTTVMLTLFTGLAVLGATKEIAALRIPPAAPRLFLHATPALTMFMASFLKNPDTDTELQKG